MPALPPSFPIGLLKTESNLILKSVETNLVRWKMVKVVVSVDTYPLLAYSGLPWHVKDTGIGVFWLHCAAL